MRQRFGPLLCRNTHIFRATNLTGHVTKNSKITCFQTHWWEGSIRRSYEGQGTHTACRDILLLQLPWTTVQSSFVCYWNTHAFENRINEENSKQQSCWVSRHRLCCRCECMLGRQEASGWSLRRWPCGEVLGFSCKVTHCTREEINMVRDTDEEKWLERRYSF